MKVLQTPIRYPPAVGGVENYVASLSREFVFQGHEVSVVCANEPKGAGRETVEGVDVTRLSYWYTLANTNVCPTLLPNLLLQDVDVIHTHLPTPYSADMSALAALAKKKPLILTYHDDLTGQGVWAAAAGIYNHTLLRLPLASAKKIIVTQEKYITTSPYLKPYTEKIAVIPPGVDTDFFKPLQRKKRGPTIGFLSVLDRYHAYKGLDVLLSAMDILTKELPEARLIVGGDGPMRKNYEQRAANLGVQKKVSFVGRIAQKDLPAFYSDCDIFVLPSTSSTQEGFGMVLLEALACGTPVVASDIVGLAADIRGQKLGAVVEKQNPHALAQAIHSLLIGKKTITKKQRNWLHKKYAWPTIADRIATLYDEAAT